MTHVVVPLKDALKASEIIPGNMLSVGNCSVPDMLKCPFAHLDFDRLHPVLQSVCSDVLRQNHRVPRGHYT